MLGNNIQFVLNFDTEEELQKVFNKVKTSGKVISQLQEVHWGALFGSVVDKFGIT